DGPAQRPGLRLLSPRSLLRRAAGGRGSGAREERAARMTSGGERRGAAFAVVTAFLALFSIVGFALYGLPFFYDYFVRELHWTRQQVTSGNAYSKLVVGPLFGFAAGFIVDRFGPRRLMLVGIVMAGLALVGLGTVTGL